MSGLVSAKFRVTGDFGAAFTDMYERGFNDGVPVIPPTESAVLAMLDAAGPQPDELLAVVPPEGGPAAFLDPLNVVAMVADAMACYGNNGYLRALDNPLVIFSPGHAKLFADAGGASSASRTSFSYAHRVVAAPAVGEESERVRQDPC